MLRGSRFIYYWKGGEYKSEVATAAVNFDGFYWLLEFLVGGVNEINRQ